MYECAICGKTGDGEMSWFLVVGNRWRDNIKILQWEKHVARQQGVLHLCSALHVRDLVVHWMTTGNLHYPFARVPGEAKSHGRLALSRGQAFPADAGEVDTTRAHQIGEIAIHRESLQRALRENPETLEGMLEALLGGLQRQAVPMPSNSQEKAEPLFLIPQEV